MSGTTNKRLRILAIILLFIIGLNALAAGYSFMVEPSGKDIGISTEYLKYSPFDNYFIPGLVLFVVNGLLSIVTAVVTIRQWQYYPRLLAAQGAILLGWIVIQMIMVRDVNLLHWVCGTIGIALMLIGLRLSRTPITPLHS